MEKICSLHNLKMNKRVVLLVLVFLYKIVVLIIIKFVNYSTLIAKK